MDVHVIFSGIYVIFRSTVDWPFEKTVQSNWMSNIFLRYNDWGLAGAICHQFLFFFHPINKWKQCCSSQFIFVFTEPPSRNSITLISRTLITPRRKFNISTGIWSTIEQNMKINVQYKRYKSNYNYFYPQNRSNFFDTALSLVFIWFPQQCFSSWFINQ